MTRRRYKNPPLDEAICEFRFESGSPWDVAVPGLLVERMSDDLPVRRQASTLETATRPVQDGIEQQVTPISWLQLWQEDEKATVQVAPNLLSVNRLAPYPGWENFLPLVEKSLSEYRAVANPKGFERITLRYINRISFEGVMQLEDYFDFYPFVGQRLPQHLESFFVGAQVAFEGGRDVLQMQMSSLSGAPSIVLDLLYFLRQPAVVEPEGIFEWIECAHERVEDAFEGCIKDPLRERFGEVKE